MSEENEKDEFDGIDIPEEEKEEQEQSIDMRLFNAEQRIKVHDFAIVALCFVIALLTFLVVFR